MRNVAKDWAKSALIALGCVLAVAGLVLIPYSCANPNAYAETFSQVSVVTPGIIVMHPDKVVMSFDGYNYPSAGETTPYADIPWQGTVKASWYGAGGYTADGSACTSTSMGVACNDLPLGTKIELGVGTPGHDMTATCYAVVDDTGGFSSLGRFFDLQPAVLHALGLDPSQGIYDVWYKEVG
jgi:hypothetical protein